ncbi:hypothetical protein EDB89DRAFT_229564 [Lactarius sanguifluus]|nr:hypothetical protein EDB89DRAFT_229564 [Lactarius sanguifluus]
MAILIVDLPALSPMFRKLLLVLIAVTDLKFCGRRHSMRALVSTGTACLRHGATRRAARRRALPRHARQQLRPWRCLVHLAAR